MKINTKILLLIGISLFTSSGIISILAVWQIDKSAQMTIQQIEKLGESNLARVREDGGRERDEFRERLLNDKKEYLRSQVQTAISVLSKNYSDANDPDKLKMVYREQLQNAVNTAYGVMVSVEKEKGLSLEEKQRKVASLIEELRYGPKNEDYFWINDMNPTMIMHPYKPQLNGQDLSANKDPNGKKLFVEFVNTCRENGEGFVDYYWPKYGADAPQPKLSFVKLFEPWNWIIGTGLYIDDIDSIVAEKEKELALSIEKTSQEILAKVHQVQDETIEARTRVLQLILGGTLLLVAVVLFLSLYLARRNITKPIRTISYILSKINVRIGGAADRIASLSQGLAGAASSQAASIEETSSSMEELSAMTKQNAENANQADNLMKTAIGVVEKAEQSMKELTGSMDEISDSGQQSSKIIKTIDEIAFQTNLLALNAAVEAARAGDAGAGFAVVADEVRNLAIRAAEAAKNTSDLIEESIQKTLKGSDLLSQTDAAFSDVALSASKVGELLAEISIGSSEQAEGIEQINLAVAEMDKITQQNAATAENSAGSSVELQSETAKMKRAVGNLIKLISGTRDEASIELSGGSSVSDLKPAQGEALEKRKRPRLMPVEEKRITPQQVIPLDEEFRDFQDESWKK